MARYPRWSLAKSLAIAKMLGKTQVWCQKRLMQKPWISWQFYAPKENECSYDSSTESVKLERKWWSAQCTQSKQRGLPSELVHMLGGSLSRDVWKTAQLLAHRPI